MKRILTFSVALISLINTDLLGQSLQESSTLRLQANEITFGIIQAIQPIGNDKVIILQGNPDAVLTFNKNGDFIKNLGKVGRGPFEWLTPRYIFQVDDAFAIWDANGLKFLLYNNELEPVEELFGIKHAINGGSFKDQNTLAVLNRTPGQKEFVHLYQRKNHKDFELIKSVGNLSYEGYVLFFHANTGGLVWNGDDIVYSDPAKPVINVYNLTSGTVRSFWFTDDNFKVEPWGGVFRSQREDFQRLETYLFTNSRIISLKKISDLILIEVENFINKQSYITYHFFDSEYNYVGKTNLGQGRPLNYIRGIDQDRLIYWNEDYYNEEETKSIRFRYLDIHK